MSLQRLYALCVCVCRSSSADCCASHQDRKPLRDADAALGAARRKTARTPWRRRLDRRSWTCPRYLFLQSLIGRHGVMPDVSVCVCPIKEADQPGGLTCGAFFPQTLTCSQPRISASDFCMDCSVTSHAYFKCHKLTTRSRSLTHARTRVLSHTALPPPSPPSFHLSPSLIICHKLTTRHGLSIDATDQQLT